MQISQQAIVFHLTTAVGYRLRATAGEGSLHFHLTTAVNREIHFSSLEEEAPILHFHIAPATARLFHTSLPETTLRLACVGPPGEPGPAGPQGEVGPSGDAPLLVATATTAIGGHRAVVLVGDGSQGAIYADQSIPDHAERFVGVTTGAADSGSPVTIQIGGEITEPSWNWIPGFPVYLSVQGLLTQTPPTTGFLQIIGISLSATRLSIQAQLAFHFE